jgi:hypothetical protein
MNDEESEEHLSPEDVLWRLQAPNLVVVDGTTFSIQMELNDDLDSAKRLYDAESLVHYFIVTGPLGKGQMRYQWLGTADTELVNNPFAPADLSEKAKVAFSTFIDFTDEFFAS